MILVADTIGIVNKTNFNTMVTEIENKILHITGSVKITETINLVTKTNVTDIKNKIADLQEIKNITYMYIKKLKKKLMGEYLHKNMKSRHTISK